MNVFLSLLGWSFFGFSVRDFFDIVIVAGFLYAVLLLLKKTHSLFLFNGMGLLVIVYILARSFNFYLTTLLFNFFLGFFVIIFIVVFQRELRHFFEWLSAWRHLPYAKRETIPDFVSGQIIKAVSRLAETRTGALIVIPGERPIDQFLGGGITLNGMVSFPLLLSIFDSSSPGHDGAVIIEGNRVRAFGAHLPLAENLQALKGLGTRHRAALGLAERSDALIIVISEERGTINIAQDGALTVMHDADELRGKLYDFLREHVLLEGLKQEKKLFLRRHMREKIVAFSLAGALWYIFVVQFGAGTSTKQFDIPIEFRALPANAIIDQVIPPEASILLTGRNQDFSLFNPSGLKVIIQVDDPKEGWRKITLDKKIIANLPPSFPIISLSPRVIQFHIGRIESTSP